MRACPKGLAMIFAAFVIVFVVISFLRRKDGGSAQNPKSTINSTKELAEIREESLPRCA
jgi:hypothetical protein